MTTHSPWGKTLIRLLCGLVFLLTISSVALAQPSGTVTRLVLKSEVLGEERTVLVRTPVGYERNKLSYPVLYMTDGDAHMTHTASTIEFLTRNGRIPESIVVGVTNTDRTRDLTPVKSTDKRFPSGGGADNFLKFFETELIPHIEKEYRVQPYGQLDLAEPLYDKAQTLGQQNADPNAANYKANYERVHAKLKETTKKQ